MKRIIAFILSVIYLVFISGTIYTVNHPESYSFASAFTFEGNGENEASKEGSKTTILNKFNGLKHSKFVKHLAGGGKTKVPRAGHTPSVFTNFVFQQVPYHYAQAVPGEIPELYTHSIFLKNGVLRI